MRYLVFCGAKHYASGGAYDYMGASESLESAIIFANKSIGQYRFHKHESGEEYTGDQICWTHVFDTESKQIVHEPNDCAHNGGDMTIRLHYSYDLDA